MPSNIDLHQHSTLTASRRAAAARAAAAQSGAAQSGAATSTNGLQEVEVTAPRAKGEKTGDSGKGMSFWDLLDVVNPLQHIPIVNRVYRAITGDEIGTAAKIAGDGLYFGVAGLALAAADAVVEDMTGKDTLGNALSLLGIGNDDDTAVATAAGGSIAGGSIAGGSIAATAGAPADFPSVQGAASGAAPSRADLIAAARDQQIKELQGTPGASAAAVALSGLPPAAAVGMLGAPGAAGGDVMAMASLEAKAPAKETPKGQGLSRYWQQAVDTTPQPLRPYVPPIVNQRAVQDRSKPGGAGILALNTGNTVIQDAARDLVGKTDLAPSTPEAASSAQSQEQGQGKPQNQAPNQAPNTLRPTASAWPPGGPNPLPPELVADMMSQALTKYQAMAKSRQNAPQPTTINGAY